MKKVLYIDMDGVIADFDAAIKYYEPTLETGVNHPNPETRTMLVNALCEKHPRIFLELPLIKGAHTAISELSIIYDIYFLSTPMWNVPESFMDKRHWLEQHFGQLAYKRLILTHRKDLNVGEYLIDDRVTNGVENFKGHHLHFGTERFPDWNATLEFLKKFK